MRVRCDKSKGFDRQSTAPSLIASMRMASGGTSSSDEADVTSCLIGRFGRFACSFVDIAGRASYIPRMRVRMLCVCCLAAMAVQSTDAQLNRREWRDYGGGPDNSRYLTLDQIKKSNVDRLGVAWTYPTRDTIAYVFNPIVVDNMMYVLARNNSLVALDATTGKELWVHEGLQGIAPRGINYWESRDRSDRRLLFQMNSYLQAIDARTGQSILTFGTDGAVNLREGLGRDPATVVKTQSSNPGKIFENLLILGSAPGENYMAPAGDLRAYDVITGALAWQFHTIPHPGEFGYDTWPKDAWKYIGGVNTWGEITVDGERGIAYFPLGSPTYDFYGADRHGANLFGTSLLALDARTGKRLWHFQMVHHDLWDYDNTAAPQLTTIRRNGRMVDVVAQAGKTGFLYVFDRVTGEPVWPIVETPVPQSDVPGEKTSATQPIPSKPPAYGRNYLRIPEDLIDFTPEMRAQAKDNMARYKQGPLYNPPIVGDLKGLLGAINLGNASGGTNWPGGGYDPETQIAYAQANQSAVTPITLRTPPAGFTDIKYTMGRNDAEFRVSEGPGFGSAADAPQPVRSATPPPAAAAQPAVGILTVQGLSPVKPPYAVISAIDLTKGDLKWQVPYGETPDAVRNHPALKGMNIPNTGQAGSVGLLVTKTVVVLGDSQITTTPQHPRGAMLRAYDKATGKEVGSVLMPAPQSGSPMTYSVDGKQYIIVAVSGGAYSGEYIAYSLPNTQ